MRVICSSQRVKDLAPVGIQQLAYCALYGGMPSSDLEHVWRHMGMDAVPFVTFQAMYHKATAVKYGFLLVDKFQKQFRIGMDQVFNLRVQ